MKFDHQKSRILRRLLLLLIIAGCIAAKPVVEHCAICGVELVEGAFVVTDKLTDQKQSICKACAALPHNCFICGLPVKEPCKKLPDGRFLCPRDVKTAILDDQVAESLVVDVKDAMDRMFSRFLTFPEKDVETKVIDRIDLQELFKIAGNDFECPNVLGYIQSKTNHGEIKHTISLLGGLPRAQFKAVIAHEYSHAWVFDNVPAARRKTLGHDAHEGFCELVAYKLMEAQNETEEMERQLRNHYTRGQIDLFIEADRRFGFNEIVDWMKNGVASQLKKDELEKVRDLEPTKIDSTKKRTEPAYFARRAEPGSPQLVLKGLMWSNGRPMALINNQSFEVQEQRRVRVGESNEVIRCLAIGTNTVRVKIVGSGEEEELTLPEH